MNRLDSSLEGDQRPSRDAQPSEPSTIWRYEIIGLHPRLRPDTNYHRIRQLLCVRLRQCLTRHNLSEAHHLLTTLPKDKTFDAYALFRFIMILVESNPTELISKNVVIHLEALVSKLLLYSTEVFAEFLNYLIKHNRLEDAKELLVTRHRSINRKIMRVLPRVDERIRCMEFLLNYKAWQQTTTDYKKPICDVSTQGWIVNAIIFLRNIVGNYEYFIMAVTKMLVFYGYLGTAYLFVSEFARRNRQNTSAQVLILNLIEYLEQLCLKEDITLTIEVQEHIREVSLDKINNFSSKEDDGVTELVKYPLKRDKETALENLRRLDAGHSLVIKYSDNRPLLSRFRDLMNGLEYVENVRSKSKWRKMQALMDELSDQQNRLALEEVRVEWRKNYRLYWLNVDFVSLAGDACSRSRKNLIKEISDTLKVYLEERLL